MSLWICVDTRGFEGLLELGAVYSSTIHIFGQPQIATRGWIFCAETFRFRPLPRECSL